MMYSPELDPTIKVVFVGDKNVGKTSFLYAATTHNFPTGFIASIFDGYSKTMEIDGKRYTVLLCDTPGTMHPRIPPQHWFQYASVFLLCFDIANRESFANIESTWLPHVNLETSDVPKVLVGNKMELRCSQQESTDLGQTHDCVPFTEAKALACKSNIPYVENSAKELKGLEDVLMTGIEIGRDYIMSTQDQTKTTHEIADNHKANRKIKEEKKGKFVKKCCVL